MQRITVSLDDDLVAAVDGIAVARGYAGRSEAMRDLLRRGLNEARRQLDPQLACVATLTFVAEAGVRDLGQRLAAFQGQSHDVIITQVQVPLDHETSLHTLVLRGQVAEVLRLADALTTQRGIRHDHLSIIPARIEVRTHCHGEGRHPHEHIQT